MPCIKSIRSGPNGGFLSALTPGACRDVMRTSARAPGTTSVRGCVNDSRMHKANVVELPAQVQQCMYYSPRCRPHVRLTSRRAQAAGEPPCPAGNEASAEIVAAELAGASSKVPPEAWGQVRFSLGLAVVAGMIIGAVYGPHALFQYLSVYLVEQSLSADNLFVMYLVFQRFNVPMEHRNRVLAWGLGSAAVMRFLMIATGGISLHSMRWVSLVFAAVILQSGFSMLIPDEQEEEGDGDQTGEASKIALFIRRWLPVAAAYDGNRFFTRAEGTLKATPLFLVLLVIEFTDVVFSWDNVAAVFSCSTDMPLVWTATMAAVISLRAWYSIISITVANMPLLQTATGGILIYLGAKLVLEFFVPAVHISTCTTLVVIGAFLGTAVALSMLNRRRFIPETAADS